MPFNAMRPLTRALVVALLLPVLPGKILAQTPAQTPAPTPTAPAPQTRLASSPEAINRVVAAGLMSSDANGNFRAESLVSRAELASILVKTFQLNRRTAAQPGAAIALQDVPPTHWAYNDIQTVLKTSTMRGYANGLFYPNQRITRAEALAIFGQAYGVFQLPDETLNRILAAYPDARQAPAWSHKALATVLNEQFVNADANRNIYPLNPMTRGDLAYTLSRYLERQQQGPTPVRIEDVVDPRPINQPAP